MASDGPPWTVGQNCNVTLQHPGVSGGTALGFYLKPDTWRALVPKVWHPGTNVRSIAGVTSPLAAGKRVFEGVVLCRSGLLHVDGQPSFLTAAQWRSALLAFVLPNTALTLGLPEGGGETATVGLEEVDDRLAPLGGQFLREWEVRLVFVEV